ncbi:MAG: ferrochelatase [Bacteroidota bacterium]|nr:ferrochelatase [Bacteroidota bacterium]
MKTGVLLINLGTPDSPSTSDVRKYLSEFLNDPRVIDIPYLSRKLLVNLVIVPFRSPKSAKLYKEIWTEKGSPLLIYGEELKKKLQFELGEDYVVDFGMRYQKPALADALDRLRRQKVSKIKIIPLYPQYASSSTGSTIQKIMELMAGWEVIPSIEITSSFCNYPPFIDAFTAVANKYNHAEYDHVVFSYHGLPERQILKASAHYGDNYCKLDKCCNKFSTNNQYCYRAQCFETTRLLAQKLNIPEEKYTVSFQSRLGKDPWIKPYSDHVIIEKAKQGMKNLLVFSPAFVADCLETIYEIQVEYQELFEEHGGKKIQLVESLNTHPAWIDALKKMVVN